MVTSLVVVAVIAEDYYYELELCGNVHPGLWMRDPQDCMVAHQCGFDGEVTQTIKCNASQVWSKLASSCVWEWDPDRDDCNGSPQVPLPNDPRCVKKTGNNPDPDDCSRFVSCANGTLIAIQRCGDGTLYWPQNNTCEFAKAVRQDCGSRRIPETVVIQENDPLCPRDGPSPDPDSCRHFIQCHHGKATQRLPCPHGTAFSVIRGKCEWHNNVDCFQRK